MATLNTSGKADANIHYESLCHPVRDVENSDTNGSQYYKAERAACVCHHRCPKAAKPAVQLPVPPLTAGETALPGSAGVSPGAVNGGSVGVSSKVGDTVFPAPSAADRDACGLGPVAVTICKPLVFKVSGFLAKPSSAAHLDFSKLETDHKRFS
ncbi:hypothetical protein SUGI_0792960 [Cryptomeria japonica]|nr:hypothetical protein SUGI_0792960 [Cryptomeria japonica]